KAGGIVIGRGKQSRAAAIASEQQRASRGCTVTRFSSDLQQVAKIFIGGLFVANVELNRLARANKITNGHRPAARIGADDVADQEIAPLELILIFAKHSAYVQAAANHLLFAIRK